MIKLVFATNNRNKLKEVRQQVPSHISILSLKDIGCEEELPETHETLEENSLEKAVYIREKYGYDCFAEDTGLEVDALNGEPGVYSARYAGTGLAEDNIEKLLSHMLGQNDRKARFRTIFTLLTDQHHVQFEGIVNGHISEKHSGTDGFGYDPVFTPEGYSITFAEMSSDEKNRISHRGIAFRKLIDFLNKDLDTKN